MMASDGITGLDHVLVGVSDLEAACRTWLDMGFTLTPRGRHIHWGTANYCIMFEGDYIELLGIRDPTLFTNNLDEFLAERQGLLGLALATEESSACARSLRAAGIPAEGPKALSRVLELESGEVEPCFSLIQLTREDCAGLSAFICQHLTRNLVWQEAWLSHPNGAVGLAGAMVVCEDPGESAARLAKLPGSRAGKRAGVTTIGEFEIAFQNSAEAARSLDSGETLPSYRKPWLAALRVAVKDLFETKNYLAEHLKGWVLGQEAEGILRLPAEQANGVILEFCERPG